MNIAEKLTAIQTEIKAPKNQLNKFGNYKYRSLEDILEALKPYLSKYKVCVILKSKTVDICGMPYAEGYAKMVDSEDPNSSIETEDGAFVEMNAKGMQAPQKSGSASSYAKKYALGDLLLLDDTKDSDATNDHKTTITSSKLPSLNKDSAAYDRVIGYLNKGGDLKEVLKKYSVSSALKTELENQY